MKTVGQTPFRLNVQFVLGGVWSFLIYSYSNTPHFSRVNIRYGVARREGKESCVDTNARGVRGLENNWVNSHLPIVLQSQVTLFETICRMPGGYAIGRFANNLQLQLPKPLSQLPDLLSLFRNQSSQF